MSFCCSTIKFGSYRAFSSQNLVNIITLASWIKIANKLKLPFFKKKKSKTSFHYLFLPFFFFSPAWVLVGLLSHENMSKEVRTHHELLCGCLRWMWHNVMSISPAHNWWPNFTKLGAGNNAGVKSQLDILELWVSYLITFLLFFILILTLLGGLAFGVAWFGNSFMDVNLGVFCPCEVMPRLLPQSRQLWQFVLSFLCFHHAFLLLCGHGYDISTCSRSSVLCRSVRIAR